MKFLKIFVKSIHQLAAENVMSKLHTWTDQISYRLIIFQSLKSFATTKRHILGAQMVRDWFLLIKDDLIRNIKVLIANGPLSKGGTLEEDLV